ncbi:hypothetical protein [Mycoplasmopsis iners]|uniref:hypothetical protein n=1 Tax=Mycoplasmopsis iners TaxID=76630 RepID=UPI00049693BE|nr:hypothetical protein [Mycoplasmopsis iners]
MLIVKIILATFLLIIFTAVASLCLALLIRKSKLDKFSKTIEDLETLLSTTTNTRTNTIKRVKSIYNKTPNYFEKFNKLTSLNSKLQDDKDEIDSHLQLVKDFIQKYNIKKAKEQIKLINNLTNRYKDKHNDFEVLSESINKHWNIIETTATSSFEILSKLSEYLNINRDNLPNSYLYADSKVKELKKSVVEIENKKKETLIGKVANAISENEKRIRNFAEKIDKLKAFEFIIYKHLPRVFEEIKSNKYIDQKAYETIYSDYSNLKNYWVNEHYQKVRDDLKMILNSLYNLKEKAFWIEQKNNYWANQKNILTKVLKQYETKIEQIKIWFDPNKFEIIKKEFNQLTLKLNLLLENDEILFTEVEKIYEEIVKFKRFIDLVNRQLINSYKGIFNDLFTQKNNKIMQRLFIWILEHFNLLEQSNQNVVLMRKINSLQAQFEQTSLPAVELQNERNEAFINCFIELFAKYLYKNMTIELVKNNALLRSQNVKFNDIVKIVKKDLKAKNYQIALEKTLNYLSKEKKHV